MLLSFQRPSRAPMEGTPPRTCAFRGRPKPYAARTGQYSAPRGPWKTSARSTGTGAARSIDMSADRSAARLRSGPAGTRRRPAETLLTVLTQPAELALADLEDRTVEPSRREIEVGGSERLAVELDRALRKHPARVR